MRGAMAASTMGGLHEQEANRERGDSDSSVRSRSDSYDSVSSESAEKTRVYVQGRPSARQYNGSVKLFVELGDALYEVAYGKPLEYLVLLAIVAASIVLSLQVSGMRYNVNEDFFISQENSTEGLGWGN